MSAPDPFEILGLHPRFDLAPAELRAAHLSRSRELHPDVAGMGGEDDAAAALNQAKRLLEDPETRAEVLLTRLGGPSKEMDRSLPPSFLHEMLEIREQIGEAIDARSLAEIVKWEDWAQERRRKHIARVDEHFRKLINHSTGPDSDSLKAIRLELNMWRYVQRLIEQLSDAEGTS
jgi:molecular chaperone HscB